MKQLILICLALVSAAFADEVRLDWDDVSTTEVGFRVERASTQRR